MVTMSGEGPALPDPADRAAFEVFKRACAHVWGRAPMQTGVGGSIPFVAALADAFREAALLLTGVEDPESNAHSENESLHLGEFCCQLSELG
jgi:acetylornithine deacetylase/succinyl-diaminopimelate desuccinylase-like protein